MVFASVKSVRDHVLALATAISWSGQHVPLYAAWPRDEAPCWQLQEKWHISVTICAHLKLNIYLVFFRKLHCILEPAPYFEVIFLLFFSISVLI